MNNSEKYNLHIGFKQQVYGIRLELINGNLDTIYSDMAHELNMELPQGIYHLKISYMDYYQEKFFSIDSDTELILDFDYPLTIPVLGYSTTHEYYSMGAVEYSQTPTLKEEGPIPNFFFFAGLHDKNKSSAEPSKEWLKYYRIFNIEKTTEIQFTETNSVYDDEVGKIYFSVFLKPGLYFLNYENKENSRIFPLYIFTDYQTQFFIRYTNLPDFRNCRFFFSNKKSFTEQGIEYFVLEKILCAYSNFKNFELISEEEINIIKEHPFLVSLVNILFTVAHQISSEDQNIPVHSPVKDIVQLELPDIIYCKNDKTEVYRLSDKPPLLSFIITRYTHQLDKGNLVFEPASILDRIVDNINYDLFWNNFSKIDEPGKWANVYRPLLRTINQSSNPIVRTMTNATSTVLNYVKPQFDSNLNHLVGRTNLTEDQVDSFNDVIGKIKDVSVMSKEFGLPPTTILRNYKKYNDYFNQVKEPDLNKRIVVVKRIRMPIILSVSGALALFIGIYFFWPDQYGPGHKDNNIAAITTSEKTQTVDLPTTAAPDNNISLNDNMTAKDESNSEIIPKSEKIMEPVKTSDNNPNSAPQYDIGKTAAVDRNPALILKPPPFPKTVDKDYVVSKEESVNDYETKTVRAKEGNSTMNRTGRDQDINEIERVSRKQAAIKSKPYKYSIEELTLMKIKDTLARFKILVNLLDSNYTINKEFEKDSGFAYVYAKELLRINTEILQMIKANSSYLTSNLNAFEIDSLKGHFESWIIDFNTKQLSTGDKINPTTNFTLNNHLVFPFQIMNKIYEAFEQINERVKN